MRATGRFTVKITPQSEDKGEGSALGRLLLEKQFEGELEASGKGEMLSAGTEVKGSAVYVAVERVTGSLKGRQGSFALYHRGVMRRGAPELEVHVVPDSGSGELEGLSGTLGIRIEAGQHYYDFDYSLPGVVEA